jgi:hypothetical protein
LLHPPKCSFDPSLPLAFSEKAQLNTLRSR